MSEAGAIAADALRLAVAFTLPAALGWHVVRASAGDALRDAFGRAGEAALAFGVGVTLACATLGLAYAAHLPEAGLVAQGVVGAAALCAWWTRRRRRRPPAAVSPVVFAQGSPRARFLRALGWLALAGLLVSVALLAWSSAAAFADTHAVWLLRAKVFVADQGFDGLYFESWRDRHDRRGYPPLVSLAVAWLYEAGGVDDRAAKLLSVVWLVALLAVAHGILRRRVGPGVALALALALAACTTGVSVTVWGVADHVLAFHVLCAGGLLLAAGPRELARLLPWTLVGAVGCKNEGLVAVSGIAAAYAGLCFARAQGAGPGRVGHALRQAVVALLPAAAAWLAWFAVLHAHGVSVQPAPSLSAGDVVLEPSARVALVARELALRLGEPSVLAGWLGFFLGTLLFLRPTAGDGAGRARALAAAAVVLVLLAGDAALFLSYRGDLAWVVRFTASRVLFHSYPLALVLAATMLAGAPRGSGGRETPG